MADCAVTSFEQVVLEPAGLGPAGMEYTRTQTGRVRKPATVTEWCAQRVAALGSVAQLPAGRAVIALLEAGEDADVRAAGKPLTDWQRRGVGEQLGRYAQLARQDYPPAGPLMQRLHREWVQRWGDGERVLPPHVPEMPRTARKPAAGLVHNPPSAEHWAAVWEVMRPVPRGV